MPSSQPKFLTFHISPIFVCCLKQKNNIQWKVEYPSMISKGHWQVSLLFLWFCLFFCTSEWELQWKMLGDKWNGVWVWGLTILGDIPALLRGHIVALLLRRQVRHLERKKWLFVILFPFLLKFSQTISMDISNHLIHNIHTVLVGARSTFQVWHRSQHMETFHLRRGRGCASGAVRCQCMLPLAHRSSVVREPSLAPLWALFGRSW